MRPSVKHLLFSLRKIVSFEMLVEEHDRRIILRVRKTRSKTPVFNISVQHQTVRATAQIFAHVLPSNRVEAQIANY